jgi:hypothetical protein
MSQPHPPIPQPQPQLGGPDDDPRTQSILLPPSRRQPEEPGDAPRGEFRQPPTGALPQQPGYDATTTVTGPVDFVPGFGEHPHGSSAAPPLPPPPGPGTAAAPSSPPRRSPLAAVQRAGRGGPALLSLGLGVVALALLQVGLALDYGNQSLWEVVPTWSAFATVAALLVLVPAAAAMTGRLPARTAWRVGAAGAVALALAWVLVALPLAASDRGFWLTIAVAAAGAALWLAPGREE